MTVHCCYFKQSGAVEKFAIVWIGMWAINIALLKELALLLGIHAEYFARLGLDHAFHYIAALVK